MGLNYGIEQIKGKTLTAINVNEIGDDEIIFTTTEGDLYKMYHHQDCCESVGIEEIIGDIQDLIGLPILIAEERSSTEPDEKIADERKKAKAGGAHYYNEESETWTFYELETNKGSVTIRWYGSSNGYYSESVNFELLKRGDE